MGGSRKGEHRGNARKRNAKARVKSLHERPRDIMREAAKGPKEGVKPAVALRQIEQRIFVSKIIHEANTSVLDMTPKEIMLEAMWHFAQGARDWKAGTLALAALPDTPDTREAVRHAENETERHYELARNAARDCAGFIHAKLAAVHVSRDVGESPMAVVRDLLDELDQRQRNEPLVIEHLPKRSAVG